MVPYIIGGILVVLGAFIAIYVPQRIKRKNVEIQFAKTTTLGELKQTLADNAAAGLEGYRQYAELKGAAATDAPQKTPFSEQDAAYFNADLYQVYEESEQYTDEQGTHTRMKRSESHLSNQKSYAPLLLQDASGGRAVIELAETGMQLDTCKTLDKFEPTGMLQQYSFFSGFNFNPMGARTLGYRMVEHTIPVGQPLYVLGEAELAGDTVTIRKPKDKKKPFIVSVKSEGDLIRGNKTGAIVALVGGIVLAVAGILVMILVH